MQKLQPTYRERLAPSLWLLVSAAVLAPMASLVLVPLDPTLSLAGGVIVGVAAVCGAIWLAPRIEVRGTTLRAGRAHIDASWLGTPSPLSGDDARHARGPGQDARAWNLIRGGIDGLVIVPVEDTDDPVSAWVVSSRTPDRLAAAIERARYAAQSLQTKPIESS
ncbi:DUF3093 domain-containing protein [Microbacterium sp. NPDC078428]|uniref:DUF3093 domain-containing protein n=1 Tax=Microbacterium sp. NPDC078428 TaxID=3364190 RepID=UPI0037C575AB